MTLSILSSRDADPNIMFKLSFNISFGLPSRVQCTRDGAVIHSGFGIVSGVDYEVIRPHYISRQQPDMTRLSINQTQPRLGATYHCTVTVEGRLNIVSGIYDYDPLGNGTSSITVTGE